MMRVAVVGPCSSGKSTIVRRLREHGIEAYAVGQEHSIVKRLWDHQQPDALLFLFVDYETVQERRGASWPRWLYDEQIRRLRDARKHASLFVDTGALSEDETVGCVLGELASIG